jgi:FKBP-type peptidyl-prolyl cis-trans isomerase SlyD
MRDKKEPMTIAKNRVAAIDYTLTGDDGQVIDSSKGREPLEYIHGKGNLIPGLENALDGKDEGAALKVTIAPGEAYGEYDPKLVQPVPRANFGSADNIEVGMQFQARTPAGVHVVRVVKVDPDNVTVDANHPLAGQTLHFDVKVVSVRDAKPEELEHEHVCNHEGGCGSCGCEH